MNILKHFLNQNTIKSPIYPSEKKNTSTNGLDSSPLMCHVLNLQLRLVDVKVFDRARIPCLIDFILLCISKGSCFIFRLRDVNSQELVLLTNFRHSLAVWQFQFCLRFALCCFSLNKKVIMQVNFLLVLSNFLTYSFHVDNQRLLFRILLQVKGDIVWDSAPDGNSKFFLII